MMGGAESAKSSGDVCNIDIRLFFSQKKMILFYQLTDMELIHLAHLSAKKSLFNGDTKEIIYQHEDRKLKITEDYVPFVIDFTTERPFKIVLPRIQITLAINEKDTRYYTQQSPSNMLLYEVCCIMEHDKDEIEIFLEPGGTGGTGITKTIRYRAVFE